MPTFDLKDQSVVKALPVRDYPYWNILEYCRHIGVTRNASKPTRWIARVRLKNGTYKQIQLALVGVLHEGGIDYEEAVRLARGWFSRPEIVVASAAPIKKGTNRELRYTKTVSQFTIGDALKDYVEWKRVAASVNYFETTISLINHHIIPRLGDTLLEEFNARQFTQFCIDILESPPKYGQQRMGKRVSLETMDHERLRKRKKTLNTLISILRGTFRMAWENGEIESDRSWRLLRRVPHADVPRHYFLTRTQAKRLIAECRPDLAKLVTGALYTGCRVSELAQLRVRDVGGHFFGIYVGPMKSYRSRHVCLPNEGMSFFLDQSEGKGEEDLVFMMASGKPWTGHHKHLFKNAVRAADLPERFVFHGLRHTYASQLVQAGTPLAIVARQLGHSNTDSVSRTYGHLSCQSIEEEVTRRFATLGGSQDDPRLKKLRNTLQSFEAAPSSWPQKNYSHSGGEVVAALRRNNEQWLSGNTRNTRLA